ncbi:Uncharacterised protein [Bordetella pertussis]|nr:Uncharacterised protein [Bordetella pertussis]
MMASAASRMTASQSSSASGTLTAGSASGGMMGSTGSSDASGRCIGNSVEQSAGNMRGCILPSARHGVSSCFPVVRGVCNMLRRSMQTWPFSFRRLSSGFQPR